MTLLTVLERALLSGKKIVLDNLDHATERTGEINPFGDKTLLLDKMAEDEIISSLRDSGISMTILTEEQGSLQVGDSPEYIVIIDPIDGSANLERRIPLCTIGISAAPFSPDANSDDLEISIIDSFFTDEVYVAQRGKGVTQNGKKVNVSAPIEALDAIISYDTKKEWDAAFTLGSTRVLQAVHDSRRTASNLLDLCWVAAGSLDAMVDLREMLPVVHVCGTHMVTEAGGYVLEQSGERLCLPLDLNRRMSFVAASDETLARDILRAFHGE
jgi:myo-inositol-1(or 4)-monophosphatase